MICLVIAQEALATQIVDNLIFELAPGNSGQMLGLCCARQCMDAARVRIWEGVEEQITSRGIDISEESQNAIARYSNI